MSCMALWTDARTEWLRWASAFHQAIELGEAFVAAEQSERVAALNDLIGRGRDIGCLRGSRTRPSLDGDEGQAQPRPQFKLLQGSADERFGRGQLHDAEISGQLDVIDYVRHHQAVRDPDRHLALGKDHPRYAELLQDTPVQGSN